jgi:two-component system sensor histidine kinase BaeS
VLVTETRQAATERVLIEVRDTGIGIAPEDMPHVFDPFYQVGRSSTRATGGVGLGLSIAHQLIEVLGGQLSLTSTPAAGTTFRIDVPLRLAAPVTTETTTIVLDDAQRTGS